MFLKPQSDKTAKIVLTENSQAFAIQKEFKENIGFMQNDIVDQLMREINRVKDMIKHYASKSNDQSGLEFLNELVSEAYNSIMNYDVVLMNKYYDLLQNCD